MNDAIEIDGIWHLCYVSFPYVARPVVDMLPGGASSFRLSPYSRYNTKINLPAPGRVVAPGVYNVRIHGKQRLVKVEQCQGNVLWGQTT